MVVHSQSEYEERAVTLGTNRAMLRNLRERLKLARTDCELFNTNGWVKDFDRAFLQVSTSHLPLTKRARRNSPIR
eukprot:7927392-Pyramimonas_sp.AAC.1